MKIHLRAGSTSLPLAVFLGLSLVLASRVGFGQSNLVLLVSQPGDYIGQGNTYVTTNVADIGLSGGPALVQMSGFGYSMYLGGPGGAMLTVGIYTNAARWPFNGGSPGLSVYGNGRGCNTLCGSFQVFEIHTNGVGNVDRFWATFTQFCECGSTYMTGEVRYASALAPAVPVPKTIRVPADYATIQLALNNASLLAVDTVLVSPGSYSGALNFKGKHVRLVSSDGPAQTSIVGPAGATAVTFNSGETAETVISGFTISSSGTAIYLSGSTPLIVSNSIINSGTAIDCEFASATIRSNTILNCSGDAIHLGGAASALIEGNVLRTNNGGITMFAAGSPTIRNNILQGSRADAMNLVNQSDADIVQNLIYENAGNGIYWLTPSGTRGARVINNTFLRNHGAGIYADGYDGAAQIINNIIVGSPGLYVGGFNDVNPPIVQYNDVYSPAGPAYAGLITNLTGIAGNISLDPLFTCNLSNDLRLLPSSACIDAGSNAAPIVPGTDFNGNARVVDGDINGSAIVDLGAFEFNPAAPVSPCLYVFCPSNMLVAALPGQNAAIVSYPAPVAAPVATLSCLPASGSSFPGGTNTVTCTATYGTNSASCSFTITVVVPPAITAQPQNTNVLAGQPFSLSVSAAGSAPLTYAWSFEGVVISGATNSTMTLSNAQAANEGVYRAVVANSVGSATSSVARVRVSPSAPTIISDPVSASVSAGSNVVFSVTARGSQPLYYQWLKQGSPLAGAVAAQLVLTNAQPTNQGSYQVVVSNSVGVITSAAATLTVTPGAPFFVQQPAAVTLSAGANFVLSSLAQGSPTLAYQWRQNGVELLAATQSSLARSNVNLSHAGSYDVVVTNLYGAATSAIAVVTVNQAPLLQQGLTNQFVNSGSTVTLAVAVSGSGTLNYTWQFNSFSLTNTGPVLVVSNIQPSQSGYYRVTVANQLGSVSSTGRVSVFGPPSWVVAWGDNSGGQTNVPPNLNDVVTVAGGDFHSLALRRDGGLVAWGYNGDGQTTLPTNATRFVGIAAGSGHNLAIMENGKVIAWGRNDGGQINVPLTATQVVSVAAGDSHSVALLPGGTILAWGNNSFGQGTDPLRLTGVSAIAAGRNHNLALRTNGIVSAWGLNNSGQASVPAGLTGVAAIAAGYLHSVALLTNGTVLTWGDNSYSQTNVPAGLSNVVAIAAGDFHTLAMRADGSVVSWGDDTFGQTEPPNLVAGSVGIGSGYYHGLALLPTPSLRYRLISAGLLLEWNSSFVLQSAPAIAGPFADVPGAGQSYTNADFSVGSTFFRLRR